MMSIRSVESWGSRVLKQCSDPMSTLQLKAPVTVLRIPAARPNALHQCDGALSFRLPAFGRLPKYCSASKPLPSEGSLWKVLVLLGDLSALAGVTHPNASQVQNHPAFLMQSLFPKPPPSMFLGWGVHSDWLLLGPVSGIEGESRVSTCYPLWIRPQPV